MNINAIRLGGVIEIGSRPLGLLVEKYRARLCTGMETQTLQSLLVERGSRILESSERLVHVPTGGWQVDANLPGIGGVEEAVNVFEGWL